MFGYRVGEVPLPEEKQFASTVKIRTLPGFGADPARRPVVACSLGCEWKGVSLPHPDPHDSSSMVAGARYRFATRTPRIDQGLLGEFRDFVYRWLRKHLDPLPVDTDVSFERWIQGTAYPAWRKEQLRRVHAQMDGLRARATFRMKSFQKDEHYVAWKYPRAINGRVDSAKVYFGPWFSAIETAVYKDPAFIKHISERDRPAYIMTRVYEEAGRYFFTDFSSFEASFECEIMEACEFQLYDYMLGAIAGSAEFMETVRRVEGGENECGFRDFVLKVRGKRMSGDMNTSVGNGFTNLMLVQFAAEKFGAEYVGVVEGDDGLFRASGPIPPASFFERLGFKLKLGETEDLSEASFCGCVFDLVDRVHVADPLKVLASFGWTSSRYHRSGDKKLLALLRSKALSLWSAHGSAPICGALAVYGLRMTEKVHVSQLWRIADARGTDAWQRKRLLDAMQLYKKQPVGSPLVPMRTRVVVERNYGVSVADQVRTERYLDSLSSLSPLDLPSSLQPPVEWEDCHEQYVVECSDLDGSDYWFPTCSSRARNG